MFSPSHALGLSARVQGVRRAGVTTFAHNPAGTDTSNPVLLHNFIRFVPGAQPVYPIVATDLSGNIVWHYYANDATHSDVLTRPLALGGHS